MELDDILRASCEKFRGCDGHGLVRLTPVTQKRIFGGALGGLVGVERTLKFILVVCASVGGEGERNGRGDSLGRYRTDHSQDHKLAGKDRMVC